MNRRTNYDGCLIVIAVALICLAVLAWGLSVREEYSRGQNPIFLQR